MQVATNEWKRFEIEERKAPIAFTNIRRDFFQFNICYLQGSVHILPSAQGIFNTAKNWYFWLRWRS